MTKQWFGNNRLYQENLTKLSSSIFVGVLYAMVKESHLYLTSMHNNKLKDYANDYKKIIIVLTCNAVINSIIIIKLKEKKESNYEKNMKNLFIFL